MMHLAATHSKQARRLRGIVILLGGFHNCDGVQLDAPSGNNSMTVETI
jgi:hypothetical protein